MVGKHTHDELNKHGREELVTMVLAMQDQMDALNENIEKLIEQVRIANRYRFGRHTEKPEAVDGHLSFFNEADAMYDDTAPEPAAEEVLAPYSISEEEPDAFYGKGSWKRLPDETCKRLRHEPESWTVEVHTVEVYVGTDGEHQDEFLRGNRPKDLLRNSIVTPSLQASILNVKYVNSAPLSERMKQELLKLHVTQADEHLPRCQVMTAVRAARDTCGSTGPVSSTNNAHRYLRIPKGA